MVLVHWWLLKAVDGQTAWTHRLLAPWTHGLRTPWTHRLRAPWTQGHLVPCSGG